MTPLSLRRASGLLSRACFHFQLKTSNFCSKASSTSNCADRWTREAPSETRRSTLSSNISLSPLFRDPTSHLDRFDIELVDNDTWQVSSGIAHAYHGLGKKMEAETGNEAYQDQVNTHSISSPVDPDFDEIDNMRIRGNLFYKLDRHSKEYQEYSYDFHRRKKKGDDEVRGSQKKESLTKIEQPKESKRKQESSGVDTKRKTLVANDGRVYSLIDRNLDGSGSVEKKVRTQTFNQLTAPYHEPFCLAIFVSNASVSASVIHRATSNVVAVAHSISKDIKYDLGSTRNEATCAAVGQILAQRALEDDIHNVVYTPRKGDRLEGKLQIVLQSIIDSGLSVKVKLKQRKQKKLSFTHPA
ncbi:50S ribosomal protein L18 [Linum perenne]